MKSATKKNIVKHHSVGIAVPLEQVGDCPQTPLPLKQIH